MKKTIPALLFFCTILFLSAQIPTLSGCAPKKPATISDSGFYFDTVIGITLYDSSKQYALSHCMEMAQTFESYFSNTLPDSDVSKINAHPLEPIEVHPETAELIQKGLSYGEKSGGRFDITIGKLSALWAFEKQTVPKTKEIKKAAKHVDYKNVVADGNTVTLNDPHAALDLGGIAKGYIADKMKEYLENEGITSGLINLGGNVLTLGQKPDHTDYTIGIQKPFSDDGTPIVSVDVEDESVVTSGVYQRYFEADGVLYHHIIDPHTGYPCANGLHSVTILSQSSADGDALSTMVFLMGLEDGMSYVEADPTIEAIFITEDNALHYSSGFSSKYPYKEY